MSLNSALVITARKPLGGKLLIGIYFIAISAICMEYGYAGNFSVTDDFTQQPEDRWRFVSDQVMGGVSFGQLQFKFVDGVMVAHMTGNVSTENNGGFIQFRRAINAPSNANGLALQVRGNNQKYFVHFRTRGTLLPWQYYQAEFLASDEWTEVKISFDKFVGSSRWLTTEIQSSSITSIGVVAFGRPHQADIQVKTINFY